MINEHRMKANPPPVLPEDQDLLEVIDEALEDAARKGIIVDTGGRRWSKRTGRYEIVWESKIFRCH